MSVCFLQKYGEELACQIAEHDDVLDYVFTLLQHDKTCLTACQFLEDLLQARKQVLNLNNICKFHRVRMQKCTMCMCSHIEVKCILKNSGVYVRDTMLAVLL